MNSRREEIERLLQEHGSVPPLWAYLRRTHPLDIGWRMGPGESYKDLFREWQASLSWSFEQRVAYLRRWDPPYSWLQNVAFFLWPEVYGEAELEVRGAHFCELERLGFGSKTLWKKAFNIGSERYPRSFDTSSTWCSPIVRVTHARFGDGTVLRESEGNVEVRFDDGQRRVIKSEFLVK